MLIVELTLKPTQVSNAFSLLLTLPTAFPQNPRLVLSSRCLWCPNKASPELGAYRPKLSSYLHVSMIHNRTNEAALTKILLRRSNADLALLKNAYWFHRCRNFIQDVKGDLSMKLSGVRPPPNCLVLTLLLDG